MNSQNLRVAVVKKPYNTEIPHIPSWKRAIDLTCCLLALPLLCLVTAVMTVFLRFVSGGPVFFKQERVGYKGTRFMCYKFRTMKVGADTKSHQKYCDSLLTSGTNSPMVKLDAKGDTRVIPLAWILRATGLDELPQIINVYRKEMSIVGPRPCLQYEFDKYEPAQRKRFNAVPGLTGLWQVSGKNRTTFQQMIDLDIQYSESGSFWLDMRIIVATAPAMAVQVVDTVIARNSQGKSRHRVSTLSSAGSASKRPQPVN